MSDFANGLAKPQTPEAVQLIRPARTIRAGIALLAVSVGAIQFVLEHGEREDWFDSRQIVALSVIGIVGWLALLWRELTTNHPAIDFRVLRRRRMWVGTVLGS